jgi:hypothetical protein
MAVSKLSAKQLWSAVWTPGVNLANFFNLYDSKGDVTVSTPTSIPTTLDGPIQVARYGALTVNASLTASHRCRGLIVLSDSLSVGAAGSVSMTARGAAGSPKWAVDKDIFVPQAITFSGKNTSYADFLKWIRTTGYCIFDPSMYACPPPGMGDVTCDWATWTPYGSTIISAAGCGGYTVNGQNSNPKAGNAGSGGGTGSGGTGSGGPYAMAPQGSPGRPWGGGPGSNGVYSDPSYGVWFRDPDRYGGLGGSAFTNTGFAPSGGGAGNPGGQGADGGTNGADGTGGVLLCICRGAVSLTAGHVFSANGSQGGAGTRAGGGSGAGSVGLSYAGALTGTPNLLAIGGLAGTGTYPGAAGGVGSTQSKSFAIMGWAA